MRKKNPHITIDRRERRNETSCCVFKKQEFYLFFFLLGKNSNENCHGLKGIAKKNERHVNDFDKLVFKFIHIFKNKLMFHHIVTCHLAQQCSNDLRIYDR